MNKKVLSIALCALLLLLCACGPTATPGQTSPAAEETLEPTETPGDGKVDAYADNDGNNVNYLCGIDQYGRVFNPVSGMDDDKEIGMFYFLWHGESGLNTYDNTKLLAEHPDAFWDTNDNQYSKLNLFHYWGEPLYGYYESTDEWVIARHVEMLTAAGVDFLVFDTTNSFVYARAYTKLCNVLTEYQEKGWDVPKIVFYTNSYSIKTMNTIYKSIYKRGKWKSLWYCPNGEHPMIIGAPTPEQDIEVAYNPEPLSQEFLDFFDLRNTQWPNKEYKGDGFPWMEWTYPQPIHSGVMSVSVAQHPQLPFNASIKDRSRNWGRGYNFVTGENVEADSQKGTNFQSQWDSAIKQKDNVDTVFVTGWNEWIAQKLIINGEVYFVDCATEEFSRDIEPMKGGYEDNFFMQLCDNIRRFKGKTDEITPADAGTIDISGSATQWDTIRNSYKAITQQSVERNGKSVDKQYTYTQDAARNNIQEVKLTNDSNNLYFMVRCENDITAMDQADFMNIYLGVDDLELKGWEGYEFVLDAGDKTLYALDAAGARTKVGEANVSVNGKVLQASVTMADLGTSATGQGVYFKVCDAFSSMDIMDTYVVGKCLPMGRLSYYYYFA